MRAHRDGFSYSLCILTGGVKDSMKEKIQDCMNFVILLMNHCQLSQFGRWGRIPKCPINVYSVTLCTVNVQDCM